MNELYFSNEEYKNKALNMQSTDTNEHSYVDAFFLLINGESINKLDVLCDMIQKYYQNLPTPIMLSIEDCYKLTQNINISETEKQIIVELAETCIKKRNHLGSQTTNDGKINTSSWISHAFYSSCVCATLASNLNLDEDKAKVIGLLHDYGRKFSHKFDHTIIGFEKLTDLGWYNEALGCLSHSFVKGGRCSNNEPALEGFFLDENGNAKWKEDTIKDDMTLFLENYKYTDYDILLNIADLMATDRGVVSPKKRIEDIATRRKFIDPTNRGYFLADITNVFINILKRLNLISNETKYIKANKNTSSKEIQDYFNNVSKYFFDCYSRFPNETKKQRKTS